MEIYTYVHSILKGDLPTRASGRERPGQSSVHFGEIRSRRRDSGVLIRRQRAGAIPSSEWSVGPYRTRVHM
jgi:hypothetical protein